MKTQEIAEQLYLEALISYPRTNSQKLPPTLNYRDIINKISSIPEYRGLVSKLLSETKGLLKPVEGEKEDPAHPAIYPTGVLPRKLTREQFLIYDLIVRRFLAVFAPQAVFRLIKAELTTLDYKYSFETSGLSVEYLGWMTYYHFHTPSSKLLPSMTPGEKLEVVKVKIRESYTKPPPKLKR
jgi:DNA topoisomerase I (EC 5.99.1.2)